MTDELMIVYGTIQKIKGEALSWSEVGFGSFICMMMEEWCREHQRDVVEFSASMAEMVKSVNEEMGKYE